MSPTALPRLRLFLSESLRLYPPVPRFDRQAIGPDRLGDGRSKPGDIISIWPWLLHRHRALWDDPDAFDIDRFAGKGGRHRFQYLPFGAGPRTCVGAQFATAEALTLLAHWLGRMAVRRRRASVRAGGDGHAAAGGRAAADPRAALIILPAASAAPLRLIFPGLGARLARAPPDDGAGDRQQRRDDAAEENDRLPDRPMPVPSCQRRMVRASVSGCGGFGAFALPLSSATVTSAGPPSRSKPTFHSAFWSVGQAILVSGPVAKVFALATASSSLVGGLGERAARAWPVRGPAGSALDAIRTCRRPWGRKSRRR